MEHFSSSRIEVTAYFLSKHHAYGSIENHRLYFIDFASALISNKDLPTATKRSGWKLQWKIGPASKKNTRDLFQAKQGHKMEVKT